MSRRSYLVSLSVFLILLVAGSVFIYFQKQRISPLGTSYESKTLPNSLSQGQASIDRISLRGYNFLIASSIEPVLRPGARATSTTLTTKDGWDEPFRGLVGHITHTTTTGDILSLRATDTTVFLDRYSTIERKTLAPIKLGTIKQTINKDGTATIDEVLDFSINNTSRSITYVVRRNIHYSSPDGTPMADSEAEIWSLQYPDGQPTKIFTPPTITITPGVADAPVEYDLPIQAFEQSGDFVIQYASGLRLYSPTTKTFTVLSPSTWNSFVRYSASPNGAYGIFYRYIGHSSSATYTFDNQVFLYANRLLHEISDPVKDVVATISWSPREDFAVLMHNLQQMSLVNINQRSIKKLEPPIARSEHVGYVFDMLSSHEILLSVDGPNTPLDEVPTYDSYGLTSMMLWSTANNTIAKVGNYRTPLYIGRLP